LVVTFAEDADIVNLHNWSRGSFSGMTWDNVKVMSIVVAVTLLMVILLAKPLEAYQLGETYAQNLGVNIRTLRILLVVLSSVLSACIVAFAGPISFVGIAVPQLIRKLFGTTKPLLMIPACFLGGSVFCLFCDLVGKNLDGTHRAWYQHSDGNLRSTGGIVDHGIQKQTGAWITYL